MSNHNEITRNYSKPYLKPLLHKYPHKQDAHIFRRQAQKLLDILLEQQQVLQVFPSNELLQ